METRKPYVGLGLVAVAVLLAVTLLAWDTSSAPTTQATDPTTPETMSLGASGSGIGCDGSACSVTSPTGSFTVTVDAEVAPDGGYSGVAAEVVLGGLTYNEREACSDELVWPDQTICVRSTGGGGQVRIGGGTGLIPPFDKSNYTGTLVELDIACPGEGEYELLLTALPFAQFGAGYVDLGGTPVFIKIVEERNLDLDGDGDLDIRTNFVDTDGDTVLDTNVPKLDEDTGEPILIEYGIADTLTITCGAEPPGVPGDGDANADGTTNSIDATLILQADAGLIAGVPNPAGADANLDEVINSIDATLILQFDAGLISSLPI